MLVKCDDQLLRRRNLQAAQAFPSSILNFFFLVEGEHFSLRHSERAVPCSLFALNSTDAFLRLKNRTTHEAIGLFQ